MNRINYCKFFAPAIIFCSSLISGCGGGDSKEPPTGPDNNASVASSSTVKSSLLSSSAGKSSLISSSSQSIVASSSIASSSVISAAATYKKVTIPSPSLSASLTAEAAQHDIWVYLPKTYFSANTPLPVIYYLPGFGDSTMLDINLPSDINTAYNSLQPSIIVIVHGLNHFYGSFFVDSPVTGNWSDLVLKDVVDFVDSHYRTIPHSRARGIAGHSMGGFGAINLAMRHPEVFGSVYSLSPGLVGSKGLLDTQMFDSEAHIKAFIAAMAPIKDLAPSAVLPALDLQWEFYFDIAYAMAFAPSTKPPYFDYPYSLVNGILVRDETIWAKWEAGFGAVHSEVQEFKGNFAMLGAIGVDCGSNDEYQWIYRGCSYFDSELTAAGIQHIYATHNAKHQDQLPSRILNFMLPFFSKNLARE